MNAYENKSIPIVKPFCKFFDENHQQCLCDTKKLSHKFVFWLFDTFRKVHTILSAFLVGRLISHALSYHLFVCSWFDIFHIECGVSQ